MGRFYLCLCLLVLVLTTACESGSRHKGELSFFIPKEASHILRTSSVEDLTSDLTNNNLLASASNFLWQETLSSQLSYLSVLELSGGSYFCASPKKDSLFDFTLITKQHPKLFKRDSTAKDSLVFKGLFEGVGQLDLDGVSFFATLEDSILVVSTSKDIILQAQQKKQSELTERFKKLLTTLPENSPNLFIKNDSTYSSINELLPQMGESDLLNDWSGLSFSVLPGAVSFTGITIPKDSTQTFLSAFKDNPPVALNFDKVVSKNSDGLVALSYSSFDRLLEKLPQQETLADSLEIPLAFLNSTQGSTLVDQKSESYVVYQTVDSDLSTELLLPLLSPQEAYRGVAMYTLQQSLPVKAILQRFTDSLPGIGSWVFVIENQLINCSSQSLAQEVISSYLTNNTLASSIYFKDAQASLPTQASVHLVVQQPAFKQNLLNWSSGSSKELVSELNFKKYPLGYIQLETEGVFAHINGTFKERGGAPSSSTGISELLSLKVTTPLLSQPQFFSNHRSKGKDIVFQDLENKINLYAANGTKLWEKQLDGPILGKIQEVDLLRNRKKQLAFCTANTFYILDRNGKDVAPFPIEFKDKVTQPLAIFDYDNNRKYRFVITQGDELLMYDSKAKIVKGFTFTKAASELVFPPKHIRMAGKDYIVIAQSNGTLSIKSRVGKDRIKVSKQFNFSKIAPQSENNTFVVITSDNIKETISTDGTVSSKNLGVSNDFSLVIRGKTKVSLDDNLLRINGRLIELPFGIYSQPEVVTVRRKTYIALTDAQTQKLYLYTTNGELVDNFPIFGVGSPSLGDATNNRALNLLVKENDSIVLLYELR